MRGGTTNSRISTPFTAEKVTLIIIYDVVCVELSSFRFSRSGGGGVLSNFLVNEEFLRPRFSSSKLISLGSQAHNFLEKIFSTGGMNNQARDRPFSDAENFHFHYYLRRQTNIRTDRQTYVNLRGRRKKKSNYYFFPDRKWSSLYSSETNTTDILRPFKNGILKTKVFFFPFVFRIEARKKIFIKIRIANIFYSPASCFSFLSILSSFGVKWPKSFSSQSFFSLIREKVKDSFLSPSHFFLAQTHDFVYMFDECVSVREKNTHIHSKSWKCFPNYLNFASLFSNSYVKQAKTERRSPQLLHTSFLSKRDDFKKKGNFLNFLWKKCKKGIST